MLYKELFKPFPDVTDYAAKPGDELPINSCRSGKLCRKENLCKAYFRLLKKNSGNDDKGKPKT